MTFEPQAMERVIEIVKQHPASLHNPHYSTPCSPVCPVCTMNKDVYDLAHATIIERDEKAHILKGLEKACFHEDYTTDTGHCSPGCPACKLLGWQE